MARDGSTTAAPVDLVVEEPLEIRLDGVTVATTMRTPAGHDFELAVGFCHADGLLAGAPVRAVRYCTGAPPGGNELNTVTVDTGGAAPTPTPRLGNVSSSCGLCGSTAIDSLRERLRPLRAPAPPPLDVLVSVPDRVREAQRLFDRTGSVHAAAAVDPGGDVVVVREDIGRHNAVDEVVGRLLLDGRLPADGMALFVSGRASFEMVQKAWAAGFPAVVAVSAPSALAVDAARQAGMTLLGFARGGEARMYEAGAHS